MENIKWLRKHKHLFRITELAIECKVDRSALNKHLLGTQNMGKGSIRKVSDYISKLRGDCVI